MHRQDVFPFFIGRARSGTTLLRAIFDGHPHLAIPPESHFIVPLRPRRRPFDVEMFLAQVQAHPRYRLWALDDRLVRDRLRQDDPATFEDGIRALFAAYATHHGKPGYGDKTPAYVYRVPVLARMFPEARFVHIIRDGRNASLSFLRTEFASGGIEEAAFAWKVGTRRGRKAGARLGSERYFEVHYEALVDDPETETRKVAAFLGLTYDPAMLAYVERAETILENTPHPAAHQNLRRAPTKTSTDWRREMPEADLETFELIAGDLLDELGYERGNGRTQAAAGRKLRLQARRVAKRTRKALARPA
ncbi:MAG: sulfotransferase [Actinomycetota bacterium]